MLSNGIYDGRGNFIMDNLLAQRKVVPMVIAIPNNQAPGARFRDSRYMQCLRTTVRPSEGSNDGRGSAQYQSTSASIAGLYPRGPSGEPSPVVTGQTSFTATTVNGKAVGWE